MLGETRGTDAATLPGEVDPMRRAGRQTGRDDGLPPLEPFTVGEVLDVPGVGSITVESFTQRNWSRVGVASGGVAAADRMGRQAARQRQVAAG